jgi:GTP-binding protein
MATLTRLPIVSLVGRPNVGKSTFFNRIVGGTRAVVHDLPGVTRDRNEAEARWREIPFTLIDTGGLVPNARTGMTAAIRKQTEVAFKEADLILFLVDGLEGPTPLDQEIAEAIRASGQPFLLVVNKVDTQRAEAESWEFGDFGMGEVFTVSSAHGRGIGDLLDAIVDRLPTGKKKKGADELVSLAFVGRPNVGKSSLVNRLLGEERMIVHEEPGTTRDSIDTEFTFDGTRVRLIDTAGLRKRSKIDDGVEYFSSVRTQRAIERCEVAAIVVDAHEPLGHQDAHIASLAHVAGKSVILLLNKWDLVEKETKTADEQAKEARRRLPHIRYAPIMFVSAKTGLRVAKIPALARQLARERKREITTSELNRHLTAMEQKYQPPASKRVGKPPRIYYGTQTGTAPPVFTLFVNEPLAFAASYRKYVINSLRESLGFEGSPIEVKYKARRPTKGSGDSRK